MEKEKALKTNLRGDVLLPPTNLKKDLYIYLNSQAEERKLSRTTILNEIIQDHKDRSEIP